MTSWVFDSALRSLRRSCHLLGVLWANMKQVFAAMGWTRVAQVRVPRILGFDSVLSPDTELYRSWSADH